MKFKPVPKDLNFPEIEHRIQKFWDESNVFEAYRVKNKGKKKWSFQDGPITANNPMGVHHAWGRTYKDIFQRYKTMKGFEQRYQNGFDCQGLWVEVEVEKELNFKSKKDIEKHGIGNFIRQCMERVHKYSMIQTEQSIRLGMWMDWGEWKTELSDRDWMKKSHSYYTMSDPNNYTIWHFLKKCFERGFIYKGTDVMPWCSRCGTAISDMEIATEGYQEMSHKAVFVRFKLHDRENEYLLVWTTTPWTLTSNTGVAVHPDFTYARVKNDGAVYYLAKNLCRILRGPHEILSELKGKDMLGWTFDGPFDYLPAQKDVVHKIIPWDQVSESEGTGMVHIAPGCGKEDFALGKEFDLTTIAPLDELGFYIDGFDWLTGKNAQEVTDLIFEDLKKRGVLYHIEDYTHRYPVCWRCDSELIFRLVDEWYISMNTLRHEIADSTRQVESWVPKDGLARELDWLKNMGDWCISKKRYWGLALPIWECKCGHFDVIGSREELKTRAVQGWDKFDGNSPHRPWVDEIKIKCAKCGAAMSRIPDVGNPWLDAGIVPYSTIRPPDDMHRLENGYPFDLSYWREWFPVHFITECFPGQFRNWFYAILTMSTVLEKKTPFLRLLGHALVRDEHGEDMHKSKGNAIWFEDAAEHMGADCMRWMFAKHNPVVNLNFGFGPAAEIKRLLLTYWNIYSFFVTYANIDRFDPAGKKADPGSMTKMDRWITSRINSLIRTCDARYDDFDAASVVRELELMFDDLSNWYLRRNRRRFWKSENDRDKETAYLVLYDCLVKVTKMIAPIMPFFAEELYQNLVKTVDAKAPGSIHLCDFPAVDDRLVDTRLENEIALARAVVSLGRAARNGANIKVRQPLSEIVISLPKDAALLDEEDKAVILEELNIKSIKEMAENIIGKYSRYEIVPRFDVLGPRVGRHINQVGAWLKALSDDEIRTLLDKGMIKRSFDGAEVTVLKDDVELKLTAVKGWGIAAEENCGVGINTMITGELESEGLIRELIHKIQLMRKEADFNLTDRIRIVYQADVRLEAAIEGNLDYLKNETLAREVVRAEAGAEPKGEIGQSLTINKLKIQVALTRIK